MDEKDEKIDRFQRIAYKRKDDILEKLRIFGNCANKSSYEYSDVEIEKIFSEILEQFYKIKLKFKTEKTEI
ncbi:MAG: hypothetical protein LBF97_03915 [Elusimicrobiota bacterium]|jgi:hypothetical protein|nr:hypothetical protein [Elusimicrobiota bacterium]